MKTDNRRGSQALILLTLCAFLYHSAATNTAWHLSEAEDKELEIQLKSLNKPYVKSFKDYGITFDCVDIYKQPAFDHPLLKNHTLQIKSTSSPKSRNDIRSSEMVKLPRRCPWGTVPIRRTTKEDLIRVKKIQQTQDVDVQPTRVQVRSFSSGVKFSTKNGPWKFYGISAEMDVTHLSGILDNQTSSTQIIISKGEKGPVAYHNVLQAGYHVNHAVEGDDLTRFFTYWTSDGYQKTGCFNALCKGFVQISKTLAPGQVCNVELYLNILRDPKTMNWLLYNDQDLIGYWPREILNNMADASQIELSSTASSPTDVPTPPTGVGLIDGAFFRRINVMNGTNNPYPTTVRNAQVFNDIGMPFYDVYYNQGCCIFYGGPGGWTF